MGKHSLRYLYAGLAILSFGGALTGGTAYSQRSSDTTSAGKPDSEEVRLYFPAGDGHKYVSRDKSEFTDGIQVRSAETSSPKEILIAKTAYALAAGPNENERVAGARSIIPADIRLDDVVVSPRDGDTYRVTLYITIPEDYLTSEPLNWGTMHEINDSFVETLREQDVYDYQFRIYDFKKKAYSKARDMIEGEMPKVDPKAIELGYDEESAKTETRSIAPPVNSPGLSGALTGKTVVLNQSHGWYWNSTRYYIQRSKMFDCLEDFSSAEFMNMYVVPALMNAGAMVKPVREPDLQTQRVIVDNSDGSPSFVKTGSWLTSQLNGFTKKTSYSGVTDNPFGSGQTSEYSKSVLSATPTASATFTLTVPASGYYNVYVTYTMGSDRATDAHYQVCHSGGVQDFRLNQTKNGGTWLLLGNFYFDVNAPASERSIKVLNDSTVAAGKVVVADAVRIGGGSGLVARRTTSLSGRPAWQEDAMHYLQFTGNLSSSYAYYSADYNDMQLGWTNRPRYAKWEQVRNSDGDNTLYLGWHTNAASSTPCVNGVDSSSNARGTSLYRDSDGDATANTKAFATVLQNSVITGARAFYQSGWKSRGVVASDGYGECNQANLGAVTGAFFEGLFHDDVNDTNAYKDPKFRAILARAMTQGIISYYGGTVFPPESPVNFKVVNQGNNQVQLSWAAGPVKTTSLPYGSAATGYRIYKSRNGFGFDSGTAVGNVNSTVLTLQPGEVAFYRVVATNTGGVSFPTETLGVGVPTADNTKNKVLIVNGYDRIDQFSSPLTSSTNIGGCTSNSPNTWRNVDYRRFNSANYVVQHGKAIAAAGYPFDSSCNELVNSGAVTLPPYAVVDWIGGQEAEVTANDNVVDNAFTTNEMTYIQNYLNQGGRLFVSNSKLGWDFGRSAATTTNRTFYNNYLKATHVADSAGVTASASSAAGIFSGLGTINFNGDSEGTYNPEASVIAPTGGAITAMTFSGGSQSGQAAAVQYSGKYNGSQYTSRLVNMNFGFETIRTESTRNAVMLRILNYFDSIPESENKYFVPSADVQTWKVYE